MDNNITLSQLLQKWSQHTAHQSMRGFMHFMRENDLSFSQISVLNRINQHGPTDIVSLSRELQISKAGAGQLIDRMIQAGWLISQPSPTDKRSKIITLTKKGKELVITSQTASMQWIDEYITHIPVTTQQEIVKGLMPLITSLDTDNQKTA